MLNVVACASKMPCYSPMRAWYTGEVNPDTGKKRITFRRSNALVDQELSLPCGKCMGCRIRNSVNWALRCMHEAQSHEENCFITLTYSDEYLPKGGTLVKKHFQDFMKRLRKEVYPKKIRFYMCGEYGSELERPHYHALIFGHDFEDKEKFKYSRKSILYTSKTLESLWPFGFSTVGALTYETAAYTAKYTTKKIYGDKAAAHYQGRVPEYATMSLRPGIGLDYFNKYQKELHEHDSVVANGREYPLPRFYTDKFDDELRNELKFRRKKQLLADKENNTIARLRVREKVTQSKLEIGNHGRNLN